MHTFAQKLLSRPALSAIIAQTLLVSPVVMSSSLVFLGTKVLTKSAQSIKVGTVESKWSAWDPQKKMIFTYIKFRVSENVKGSNDKETLIRQPGGQVDGHGMIVHGVANFSLGEKALVFVRHDADGAPALVGLAQGKFRIFTDNSTQKEMAAFDVPQNAEFVEPVGAGQYRALRFTQKSYSRPLGELLKTIKAAEMQQ